MEETWYCNTVPEIFWRFPGVSRPLGMSLSRSPEIQPNGRSPCSYFASQINWITQCRHHMSTQVVSTAVAWKYNTIRAGRRTSCGQRVARWLLLEQSEHRKPCKKLWRKPRRCYERTCRPYWRDLQSSNRTPRPIYCACFVMWSSWNRCAGCHVRTTRFEVVFVRSDCCALVYSVFHPVVGSGGASRSASQRHRPSSFLAHSQRLTVWLDSSG